MAWLQLFVSLFLASAIVWGFISYQASLGQFVQSVSATIGAMSNVVARTAETVEARRDLLDQTGQMLVVTRNLINELRVAAENQAKMAPQYAEGIRSASTVLGKLSGPLQAIGDKLMILSVPSIHMVGVRPVVTMSRPLEKQAQELKTSAQDLKVISESLSGISETIGRDGQKVSSAFIATSEQALKVIAEAEKALAQLKTQDLPKALADLKTTSENLRNISAQVDIVGNVGSVLLIVGLLLSGWCFLNSLGTLVLARSQSFGFNIRVSTSTNS